MQVNNEFSISTSAQVKALCNHFLQEYQFTSFNYARIYPDKSLLALHSDPLFAQLYLDLNCSPMAPIPDKYWQYNSFYFLAKFCKEETYKGLLNESILRLNSDNPLYFINQNSDYVEVAVFCSAFGDDMATNRYLNHLKDISHFVKHFSEKTNSLLDQSRENHLILPPHLAPHIPTSSAYERQVSHFDEFYRQLALREVFSIHLLKNLTDREIQCLYYLCRGYSYKAIGHQLSISYRTVETHLSNVKAKLRVTTTAQLIMHLASVL